MTLDCDVHVLGAGIVGRSLALALARLGLRVALRAEPERAGAAPDVRAYALNEASVELLRGLKVWDALPAGAATPVLDMHVQGDAHGAAIDFSAWQQRVSALAWITDAAVLERELASAVRFAPHITVVDPQASVNAALTALCEGKASAAREALGVAFERRDYGHQAIAARLTSDRPHRGIARQWFRAPDVLALLPFDTPTPQRSWALVWSLPDERARELLALDPAAFEQALNAATGGEAGALTLASARASWPLMQAQAAAWSGPGWVLLGDAAHVVHPLAGQGVNLGLRDVSALRALVADAQARRVDWAASHRLARWARARRSDATASAQAFSLINRAFSNDDLPSTLLRGHALGLAGAIAPLNRALWRHAAGV